MHIFLVVLLPPKNLIYALVANFLMWSRHRNLHTRVVVVREGKFDILALVIPGLAITHSARTANMRKRLAHRQAEKANVLFHPLWLFFPSLTLSIFTPLCAPSPTHHQQAHPAINHNYRTSHPHHTEVTPHHAWP